MNTALLNLKRMEFEARIFVSLGIVALICALSFLVVTDSRPIVLYIAPAFALSGRTALTFGYAFGAFMMLFVSLIRMWAGSVLTPTRVMAFTVQADELKTSGPYRIVRNPIYLADFIAMCAFASCLPPVGLLMPALFLVHYHRLIQFEEASLGEKFTSSFADYRSRTPCLCPSLNSLARMRGALTEFSISKEGFRHNALFFLFIPGFVVAAVTHEFVHAVLIGLPAVFDWAIIHTKIGRNR